jgi:hypothetical protein
LVGLWTHLAAILALATASLTPQAAVTALRSGASEALEAAGAEHGAAGLADLLAGSGSRESTRAAIAAAHGADDAHLTLMPLAALAAGPDRSLAATAAVTAERIADAFDRDHMMQHDVPADAVRAAMDSWRSVAAATDRWADVRVHALEVTVHLRAALGSDGDDSDVAYDFDALVADADPEVRRAALELLPQPISNDAIATTAALIRDDADPTVALVAAQVLCAGLAFDDDPDPILGAIDDAGMQRLRDLVANTSMPAGALIDAKRCVASDPQ